MLAKALRDHVWLIGCVTFDQILTGEPFDAIGAGEYIGRMGGSRRTPALAAMAEVEFVEGSADLELYLSAEAGTFYRFTNSSRLIFTGLFTGLRSISGSRHRNAFHAHWHRQSG